MFINCVRRIDRTGNSLQLNIFVIRFFNGSISTTLMLSKIKKKEEEKEKEKEEEKMKEKE